jgi:hypothetical protein
MTEENNEVLMLMKELVDRVKALEQQVYDKDNLLDQIWELVLHLQLNQLVICRGTTYIRW